MPRIDDELGLVDFPAAVEESERTIAEWPPGPDREWLKELLEAAKAEAEAAKDKEG